MKICKKCLAQKPEEEFYFFNKEKKQRINRCRECHKKDAKEWQSKNPELVRKAWTKGNRKREKGRICPYCGNHFKIPTAQQGCSIRCRFYLSFIKNPNGCWDWIKGKGGRKGFEYAQIWINGKCKKASHVSYELHRGKIPDGKMICHTCDRPSCVNPDHLYVGNHQQNMDDMNSRGRGNKGRMHFRKIPAEKCQQIISLRQEGKTFLQISHETGVKLSTCKYICAHPDRLKD